MRLPKFVLPALLRLHAWAESRPYFHIGEGSNAYMLRYWLLGHHSAARNHDNKQWHGRTRGRLHAWLTERFAIRAHVILRSDRDRARHDHPVDSVSVVLEHGYWEVGEPTEAAVHWPTMYANLLDYVRFASPEKDGALMAAFGIDWRPPGAIVYRRAEVAHRIVIPVGNPPAKTFWIVGRKRRGWGFHTTEGWKHWRDYLGVES